MYNVMLGGFRHAYAILLFSQKYAPLQKTTTLYFDAIITLTFVHGQAW